MLQFPAFCASWTQNSKFFVPRELIKSSQVPSLFCTSWRYKSSEFPAFLCFENLPRPKNTAFCASWTSNLSNVQHVCASATSHLQHFLLSGTPNTVAAWKWNHLSFWHFPCVEAIFGANWGQSLWWVRLWSFSTPIMALSTLQKHYVVKGNVQFDAKNATKLRRKPKGQMVPFPRMHIPIYWCFPAFLRSGNPHSLKKSLSFNLVCHVHLWNPSCGTGWFGFAARQLPKTRNRCWCAIDVGENSVQFLRN